MRTQVSKSGARRISRLKYVVVTISLFMICFDCRAQTSQQIEVQGKDSSWKLVGTVDPLTRFQIGAKGNVDFGGFRQNDDPNAGVSGNPFGMFARDLFNGDLKSFWNWLFSVQVSGSSPADAGVPAGSLSGTMHWNWIDYINANGTIVNYDEGAFFVVISKSDQTPTTGNTTDQVAQPALFYWYKKIFDNGDIAFNQKIWVWIKVHDGGRNPFSTSSFGDNRGSYTVWIDTDQKISAAQLNASIVLPNFSNTPVAQKLRTAATTAMAGNNHHVAMVLSRETPNR